MKKIAAILAAVLGKQAKLSAADEDTKPLMGKVEIPAELKK